MNPVFPTQIGYTPYQSGSSNINGNNSSQLIFGKNPTGLWEGIGLGSKSRPDPLNNLIINLTNTQDTNSLTVPAIININVNDLISVINSPNSHAPKQFSFRMREVAICANDDNGNSIGEKRMMILASEIYDIPS